MAEWQLRSRADSTRRLPPILVNSIVDPQAQRQSLSFLPLQSTTPLLHTTLKQDGSYPLDQAQAQACQVSPGDQVSLYRHHLIKSSLNPNPTQTDSESSEEASGAQTTSCIHSSPPATLAHRRANSSS